ncbi:MAG: hypothetical protein ACI4JS_07780 [Oscillospiraceae bacterium]
MINSELLSKANSGDFQSIIEVGNSYYFGIDGEQDYKKAYLYYTKAFSSDPRNAELNNQLGLCFMNGYGVAENKTKGFAFFKAGAAFGSASAKYNLADAYFKGNGVETNPSLGLENMKAAAASGAVQAMLDLAYRYDSGDGVEENAESAFTYFKQAADMGDTDALFNLGICYSKGKGTVLDASAAVDCWEKAAENGNVLSEYQVGLCYKDGFGVDCDLRKAASWFKRCIDNGSESGFSEYISCMFIPGGSPDEETNEALNYLINASNSGVVEATYQLAQIYSLGEYVEQNKELAYKLWAKAGNGGYALSSRMVGLCCRDGDGTAKSIEKAMGWFQQALFQGDGTSAYLMGMEYYSGDVVVKDHKKAFENFMVASQHGNQDANYYLGQLCENGEGIEHDNHEAFEYYTKAADAGCVNAYPEKARFHFNGLGGAEKNPEIALKLLEKAYDCGCKDAGNQIVDYFYDNDITGIDEELCYNLNSKLANDGYSDAQYNMSDIYRKGIFVPVDYEKSIEWAKIAADNGSILAACDMGHHYFIESNYAEAIKYWEIASPHNILAQTNLGMLLLENIADLKNVPKGIALLTDAANHNFPKAQHELGLCYVNGDGVPKDIQKAFSLFEAAANQDYMDSYAVMGYLYSDGVQCPKNPQKAIEYLTKAAEAGRLDACSKLGMIYYLGELVPANLDRAVYYTKLTLADANYCGYYESKFFLGVLYTDQKKYSDAFNCYLDAARHEHPNAQYELSRCYFDGMGVDRDYKESKYWLQKAIENGVPGLEQALKDVDVMVQRDEMLKKAPVTRYNGSPSIKESDLWDIYSSIDIANGNDLTFEIIEEELTLCSAEYGLPLAIGYGEIKYGGLFNSEVGDCLVIANPDHLNDYFKFAISITYKGNHAYVKVQSFGHSTQMEKADKIEYNKQDRKGKETAYKVGSLIGGAIHYIGFSKEKLMEEQQYYQLVIDAIKTVFGVVE